MEAHTSAHENTETPPIYELMPLQVHVLTCLLRGARIAHAGRICGVRREAISRWIHRPGVFRDAYKAELARMAQASRDTIDAMLRDAQAQAADAYATGEDRLTIAEAVEQLERAIELTGVGLETRRRLEREHGQPVEEPNW